MLHNKEFYPKKFGLIKRKMTPEAPRRAIPTTTLMIIFFPPGLPVAIMIPQMMIKTNETIKIIVTSILVRLHIKTGNAVSQVTLVSPGPWFAVLSSIQLPINGTEVLSDIQQQTHSALQDLHTLSTSLYPSLHVHHKPPKLTIALSFQARLELIPDVQGVQFVVESVVEVEDVCVPASATTH